MSKVAATDAVYSKADHFQVVSRAMHGGKLAALKSILISVGESTKEGLRADPDMPKAVKDAISSAHEIVWKEMETTILEKSGASTNPLMDRYRQSLVRYRAKPLTCCDGPILCMRSKLLYALMPSDGTLWSTLRDPFCCIVRVLMLLPVISIVVFVLLFLVIEKRDEFQLVHFITMAKGFACIAWDTRDPSPRT
jgi:hypothetical protein